MSRPTLPKILTIDQVNASVADYLAVRSGPMDAPPTPSPLDVYLLHLLIEFAGRSTVAIDLACSSTFGVSTIALLSQTRVREVLLSESSETPLSSVRCIHEQVGRYLETWKPSRKVALKVANDVEEALGRLVRVSGSGESAIALAPAEDFRGEGRSAAATFLDRFPQGLVVVLGVGRPGTDEAVAGLLRASRDEEGTQVRFLRDAASSLFETTTAILARGEIAPERFRRIADLFTTNYDFLTILRDSCLYAIERGARSTRRDAAERTAAAFPARFASRSAMVDATHLHRELREENERLASELREAQAASEDKRNPLLIPMDRAVDFGRRHRSWIAPMGSTRERAARYALRVGRRLRGA